MTENGERISPHDPVGVGRRVRERRRLLNKNQQEVADALGVSRPTYINIEAGRRGAKPSELIEMARLFGCQVADLVADTVHLAQPRSLLVAADLCRWVDQLDMGEVTEGAFARFVGVDRVSARIVAESCRSMAAVVARHLPAPSGTPPA